MKKFGLIVLLAVFCAGVLFAAKGDMVTYKGKSRAELYRITDGHTLRDSNLTLGGVKSRVSLKSLYNATAATTAVTFVDSGTLWINNGSASSAVVQLPTPATGVNWMFSDTSVVAGADIFISAPVGIPINGVGTTNGVTIMKHVADSHGALLQVIGTSTGAYIVGTSSGVWINDTSYIH